MRPTVDRFLGVPEKALERIKRRGEKAESTPQKPSEEEAGLLPLGPYGMLFRK